MQVYDAGCCLSKDVPMSVHVNNLDANGVVADADSEIDRSLKEAEESISFGINVKLASSTALTSAKESGAAGTIDYL